jgi:hypothetical protein
MGAVGRTELRDQGLDCLLHRVLGEHHGSGDLLVRVPLGQILQKLELPGAECVLGGSFDRALWRGDRGRFGWVLEVGWERSGDRLLDQGDRVVWLRERRRLLGAERLKPGRRASKRGDDPVGRSPFVQVPDRAGPDRGAYPVG